MLAAPAKIITLSPVAETSFRDVMKLRARHVLHTLSGHVGDKSGLKFTKPSLKLVNTFPPSVSRLFALGGVSTLLGEPHDPGKISGSFLNIAILEYFSALVQEASGAHRASAIMHDLGMEYEKLYDEELILRLVSGAGLCFKLAMATQSESSFPDNFIERKLITHVRNAILQDLQRQTIMPVEAGIRLDTIEWIPHSYYLQKGIFYLNATIGDGKGCSHPVRLLIKANPNSEFDKRWFREEQHVMLLMECMNGQCSPDCDSDFVRGMSGVDFPGLVSPAILGRISSQEMEILVLDAPKTLLHNLKDEKPGQIPACLKTLTKLSEAWLTRALQDDGDFFVFDPDIISFEAQGGFYLPLGISIEKLKPNTKKLLQRLRQVLAENPVNVEEVIHHLAELDANKRKRTFKAELRKNLPPLLDSINDSAESLFFKILLMASLKITFSDQGLLALIQSRENFIRSHESLSEACRQKFGSGQERAI